MTGILYKLALNIVKSDKPNKADLNYTSTYLGVFAVDKLVQLKIRIITHSLFLMFLGIFVLALIDFGALLRGWIYGSLLGILSLLLLARTMERAVTFNPNKARVYTIFNYLLRYAVLFAALYVAVQRPDMNIITVVLGLMIPKIVILYYDLGLYSLRRNRSNPDKKE